MRFWKRITHKMRSVHITFVVVLSLMMVAWILSIRSLFNHSFVKLTPILFTVGSNSSQPRWISLLDTEGCNVTLQDVPYGRVEQRSPLCALSPPMVLSNDSALWLRSPRDDQCCFQAISNSLDPMCLTIPAEGYQVLNEKRIGPELVRVKCKSSGETSYHAFVPLHDDSSRRMKVNVLMLGFSGLNATNFPRILPRTWSILTRSLHSAHMKGYSKVHGASFPCISTALTGLDPEAFRSRCLPESSSSSSLPREACPWAWQFFAKNGYRTMLAEDWPHSLLKMAASARPHYWTTPLCEHVYRDRGSEGSRECVGLRSQAQFLASYLTSFGLTFASANAPFFAVVWSHALEDDLSTATHVDDAFADALRRLLDAGALQTTALVLTSEPQGNQMPALVVAAPDFFSTKHPQLVERLDSNQRRLTTPRDLYLTFADVVYPPLVSLDSFRGYDAVNGLSLLQLISPLRTCEDAGIDPEVCRCSAPSQVPKRLGDG